MSHLKYPPSAISTYLAPLALVAALMFNSGCTLVHIPSYRLEECAAENCSSPPALLPPVPLPGWLARWKAQKDLPKPPESPRFHPLPTRPMFERQPNRDFSGRLTEDAVCFGKL